MCVVIDSKLAATSAVSMNWSVAYPSTTMMTNHGVRFALNQEYLVEDVWVDMRMGIVH